MLGDQSYLLRKRPGTDKIYVVPYSNKVGRCEDHKIWLLSWAWRGTPLEFLGVIWCNLIVISSSASCNCLKDCEQQECLAEIKKQKQNITMTACIPVGTYLWPLWIVCFKLEAIGAKPADQYWQERSQLGTTVFWNDHGNL